MRLATRSMLPADRSFVVESWIAAYRRSAHAGLVSMDDWHDVMTATIAKIIDRPEVRTLVAVDLDATDTLSNLFGHLVYEPFAVGREYNERSRQYMHRRLAADRRTPAAEPLVWFCYVKRDFRKNGIARRMFNAASVNPRAPFHYVCNTQSAADVASHGKIPKAVWRSLLGRFPDERRFHGQPRPEEPDADAA